MIKHFLLVTLCPTLIFAQRMELTQQLGKTVLYGDIALSPDGASVAWVESTAATVKPKQLYLSPLAGNAAATPFPLPGENGERVDSDPAWAPDSKTIAFFSTAGEKDDQRQLWRANADGSNPQKLTMLQGYAARPRWSANGKQIAFLYIEGAGGGGPLVAAPSTTGVVDTAIHNQRIGLLDLATKQVRQVSPADLHIYDFDWSPDGKTFVTSAAPGPGDNNWWLAEVYTIDLGWKLLSIARSLGSLDDIAVEFAMAAKGKIPVRAVVRAVVLIEKGNGTWCTKARFPLKAEAVPA